MSKELSQALDQLRVAVEGLLDVQEQCVGRPIVDAAAKAQADALRTDWLQFARAHSLNGEARGVAVLDTMLRIRSEAVQEIVPDDVDKIIPEYRIDNRWRVDRAIFHRSGRVTIVEAKDGASPREVVAGIGQALFYKAVLERTTSHCPIVPVLAVLHDHDEDIARACSQAGVEYLPLGDVSFTRTLSKLVGATMFNQLAGA